MLRLIGLDQPHSNHIGQHDHDAICTHPADLDFDVSQPSVNLSSPHEMRLPLRWIAILFGHVKANLAATSGIHNADGVIKMLMAGADVTMMCSILLKHGPDHIKKVLHDMEQWMTENEYKSVSQMIGSLSQKSVADPAAFERANYMKSLYSYK